MTRYYKALRMMIEGLLSFLSSNSGVYNTYQPMVDSVTDLTAEAGKIDAAEMSQQININGYTTVKRNKRKTMALKGSTLRKKVQGAASDKNDPVTYSKMNITFTKMMYGSSNTGKLLAKSIYDEANSMSPADKALYNITDAELAAFLLCIDEYSAVLVAPRSAIANRKTATDSIPALFTNAMKIIETRCDKFAANFIGLPFYSEYFAHRVVVDPSYSITTIEAVVKGPDNTGLYGVKMKATGKVSGKIYEDMTNVEGGLKKPEISPEVYDIEFDLPDSDYQKLTITDVEINSGEHQKFNVVLQKKPQS